MSKLLTLFITGSLMISNCSNYNLDNSNNVKTVVSKTDSLTYTINKFNYQLNVNDTIVYQNYDIYNFENQTHRLIINTFSKSIEIFNLTIKKRIFSKPLESYELIRPGININSIDFLNFDSIFIATEYSIFLLDTISLNDEYQINKNLSAKSNPLKLYNLNHTPISYDYITKGILMGTYSPYFKSSSKDYYSFPVDAIFYPESSFYQSLPVKYPVQYIKYYFGFANHAFRTVSDSLNIYSFPIDNNFYIYNRKEQSLDTIVGLNLNNPDNSTLKKKYDNETERKMQHMVTIPFHLNVLFDSQNKLFYWFIAKELPIQNVDGTYNTWGDKPLLLHVYDSKGEFLNELELGSHKYSYFKSFVGSEGLYLSYADYKNPEYNKTSLVFDIINFKNE